MGAYLSGLSPLDAMMAVDYKTYLAEDILTKMDRASMSVSLEAREPLLDHRISEWAARLPARFKLRDGKTKWIEREILHRHVPQSLMDRPKMGFGIPIFKWLGKDMAELIHQHLNPVAVRRHGLLRPRAVGAVVAGYFAGAGGTTKDRNDRVQRLWLLLMFQMWHARWMEGAHG
jgi:asparagine synthase (glutamine-hydrolysing)